VGQSTKVITSVGNIDIIEVTKRTPEDDVIESTYYVQGQKYPTLREARDAARRIADEESGIVTKDYRRE
jgi:hypothetical protein